ncbi:MAG: LamG-like jellyroll fold domain-containing protein [Lacipirellulaceae bacterium]
MRTIRFVGFGALALAVLGATAPSAEAGLRNRYSFNSNVNDSIGGANGVVVDAGSPTAFFAGGQLDLSGNPVEQSGAIVEAAFVDLPNGLISSAAAAGTAGAITMEWWATPSIVSTWMRLGDFSVGNPEGSSTGTVFDNSTNLFITIADGRSGNRPAAYDLYDGPAAGTSDLAFRFASGPAVLTAGVEVHVASVYDMNNTTGGPAGTISIYVDGVLGSQVGMSPGININSFNDTNNWLGRAAFNDRMFAGSFNEFRIYDMAMSAGYLAQSFAAGPNQIIPEPASLAMVVVGALGLAGGRRSRR